MIKLNGSDIQRIAGIMDELIYNPYTDGCHAGCDCGCGGDSVDWDQASKRVDIAIGALKAHGLDCTDWNKQDE